MRKAMQQCVHRFIETDENSALLLVDIGAWPFHDLLERFPKRAKNIGIFEPGTISLAAGLSLSGIVPTVYGISPFIAERSLEQLKLDFAYQKTGGNFIVTGASYDFSTLGYSHYCPEDVGILRLIPGIDVLTPGTPSQFITLWDDCHNNGRPSYFRMTDHCNQLDCPVEYGKATVLKRGSKGLVITAAETLDIVWQTAKDMDVTVLYYATIAPFDTATLREVYSSGDIFVCSPFYEGSFSADIQKALEGKQFSIRECSVPLEIIRNYGTKHDKDVYCGLTEENIKKELNQLFA